MSDILIIDDNLALCDALAIQVSKLGHAPVHRQTLREGLESARKHYFDVIYLDVALPDGNGLEAIEGLRRGLNPPEVIIITGRAEVGGARLAIESGAWDYVEKGSSLDDMVLPLTRALQYRSERKPAVRTVALKRDGIIGESPAVSACLDQVAAAAGSDLPVLLTGETGSGKELFAWAVHENSPRVRGRFVVVDCAALPESLVESQLFGYEAGSFTGASRRTEGLVQEADGGTLFLDEIGELPLGVQKSFLRVLQEQSFRRIGGLKELKSDFRVIAATNRDLEALAKTGGFRQDLLYRIMSCLIHLPPLRQRVGDIELLTAHHLNQASLHQGLPRKGYTPKFIETLKSYDWPGNIRELFNVLDQALISAGDAPTLYHSDLPAEIRFRFTVEGLSDKAHDPDPEPDRTPEPLGPFKEEKERRLDEFEKNYLQKLMTDANWDIKTACRSAQLSRPRLYELLRKHGFSRKKG